LSAKAQALSADFAIAVAAFLLITGVVFLRWLQIIRETEETRGLSELIDTVSHAGSILLSEGTPKYWNVTNVKSLGLVNDDRLNRTKILSLWDLGYDRVRSLLGVGYELYFEISNATGILSINGRDLKFGIPPSNAQDVAKVERVSILDDQMVFVGVIVWQ